MRVEVEEFSAGAAVVGWGTPAARRVCSGSRVPRQVLTGAPTFAPLSPNTPTRSHTPTPTHTRTQGATCYMNSLLQYLYNVPLFRKVGAAGERRGKGKGKVLLLVVMGTSIGSAA